MENEIFSKTMLKVINRLSRLCITNRIMIFPKKIFSTRNIPITTKTRKKIISLFIFLTLWVQVPQWEDDWSKCAIDIPDSSCHWYVKSPDNTYGKGFDWENAPWFDANGLNDIARNEKETVLEKLQKSN